MSISALNRSILRSVGNYEELLQHVTEERFTETPAEDVWSYAEVFSHIFRSNMSCFTAMDRCIKGTALEVSADMHWKVKLLFFFGRLPPGTRYKVPEKLRDQVVKVSREEARQLIDAFKKELHSITQLVPQASPTQKVKHPRMGPLNAKQWLRFVDIHTRHHERQLKRISKQLAVSG